jgi:signal transduction histidine kinase
MSVSPLQAGNTDAHAAIALSLLPPGASLPGLGKVAELLPNHKIVETLDGAPQPPGAWKSFLAGGKGSYVMPTLYAEAVKQDLAKIVRFARNLPAKKENLAAEYAHFLARPLTSLLHRIERITETARVYHSVALVAAVLEALRPLQEDAVGVVRRLLDDTHERMVRLQRELS